MLYRLKGGGGSACLVFTGKLFFLCKFFEVSLQQKCKVPSVCSLHVFPFRELQMLNHRKQSWQHKRQRKITKHCKAEGNLHEYRTQNIAKGQIICMDWIYELPGITYLYILQCNSSTVVAVAGLWLWGQTYPERNQSTKGITTAIYLI